MTRLRSLLLLALACSLCADDTAPLQLGPGDFELLPLDELEQPQLLRDQRPLATRMQRLGRQRERLRKQLQELDAPRGAAADQLRAQLAELERELAPLVAELTAVLRADFGIDDSVLRSIKSARPGENRVARYAHDLVLEFGALSDAQRALLEPLVADIDGAQLAWLASQRRLERQRDDRQSDALQRQQIQALSAQSREAERRFWIVVDVVLDTSQRAAVRRMLPNAFDRHVDNLQHLYRLPGLTPSQSTRLEALVAQVVSEGAADQVEIDLLNQELRNRELARERRDALTEQRQAAQDRQLDLRLLSRRISKQILTPEQLEAWDAIPPYVTVGNRNMRSEERLRGIKLEPEQSLALAALRENYEGARDTYNQRAREIREMGADFGPDSPQMQMMETMMMGLQGDGQQTQREAARTLYLEILTPEQLSAWMLGI